MTNHTGPIPPIYGYIAQPKYDPSTGQTIYVAAGEPVLIPQQNPTGQMQYAVQNTPKPSPKPPKPRKNTNSSPMQSLTAIGDQITKASENISREFNNFWDGLFK